MSEREPDELRTDSGIEVRPMYEASDLEADGFDPERDLGSPGSYPFTRGPYPSMFRGRLWTMRQYAGMGTAAQTNARFRYLEGYTPRVNGASPGRPRSRSASNEPRSSGP